LWDKSLPSFTWKAPKRCQFDIKNIKKVLKMSRALKILSRAPHPEPTASEGSVGRGISPKTSSSDPEPQTVRQARFTLNPPLSPSSTPRSAILEERLGQRAARSEQTRREEKRERIALETINKLMVTISHYLSNPLTVLLGRVELLSETNENGGMSEEDIKKFTDSCKREIHKIDSIIKVFQNLCEVRYKTYPPGVKMLDVEREIKNRLKEIEAFI
jgi:signal transduction histidine kinase